MKNVIEFQNVSFAYSQKPVIENITFQIAKGTTVVLVGPSGSGKTTILKLVNGLLTSKNGDIYVFEFGLKNHYTAKELKKIRRKIGYIPQQLGLIKNRTVLENVLVSGLYRLSFMQHLLEIVPSHELNFAEKCLEQVGIAHLSEQKIYQLSGGERQRVTIARALYQKPELILADELISNLDFENSYEIMKIIKDIQKKGTTIFMALHNLEIAHEFSDKIMLIKAGKLVNEFQSSEIDKASLKWHLKN
mgnify:CR=1 FL=1